MNVKKWGQSCNHKVTAPACRLAGFADRPLARESPTGRSRLHHSAGRRHPAAADRAPAGPARLRRPADLAGGAAPRPRLDRHRGGVARVVFSRRPTGPPEPVGRLKATMSRHERSFLRPVIDLGLFISIITSRKTRFKQSELVGRARWALPTGERLIRLSIQRKERAMKYRKLLHQVTAVALVILLLAGCRSPTVMPASPTTANLPTSQPGTPASPESTEAPSHETITSNTTIVYGYANSVPLAIVPPADGLKVSLHDITYTTVNDIWVLGGYQISIMSPFWENG